MNYKPDKGIRNEEDKMIIKTLHAPNNIASKCTEQELVTGGGKKKKRKKKSQMKDLTYSSPNVLCQWGIRSPQTPRQVQEQRNLFKKLKTSATFSQEEITGTWLTTLKQTKENTPRKANKQCNPSLEILHSR